MKKSIFLSFVLAAGFVATFLTGCGDDPDPVDESGYLGPYTGFHFLVDSATLKSLIPGGDTISFLFPDTLTVTNGSSIDDGNLDVESKLLNKTISINVKSTSNNITPVTFGSLVVGNTTFTGAKITSGTGTWNASKTTATTQLIASATYAGFTIPNVKLNGSFSK